MGRGKGKEKRRGEGTEGKEREGREGKDGRDAPWTGNTQRSLN